MRDTLIKVFEIIVWVVAALIVLLGVGGGIFALINGEIAGLLAIIFAPIAAVIYTALIFIVIGNYHNLRRIADAAERMGVR
ncbi:hypothetical protein [Vannielia litorea]|uniref:hypothetical protein n=1 Tax=Vannielia litorea TaxID=1217970 RepID=UPI001BCD04BF|nr:hypothetical protein [Vannielia litorea]MBS8226783.1 hypothetical protein [Vannielia litorea]